jgi:hypothetical protein
LWNETSYTNYETDLTQSILPPSGSGVTYSNAQSCLPSGVCRPIDNLTTALLAALAHEVGHIAWYVEVDSFWILNNFCNDQPFLGDSKFFGQFVEQFRELQRATAALVARPVDAGSAKYAQRMAE